MNRNPFAHCRSGSRHFITHLFVKVYLRPYETLSTIFITCIHNLMHNTPGKSEIPNYLCNLFKYIYIFKFTNIYDYLITFQLVSMIQSGILQYFVELENVFFKYLAINDRQPRLTFGSTLNSTNWCT